MADYVPKQPEPEAEPEEEEDYEPDEGLDAASVAHDHLRQALKIISDEITEEWAKNSLIRNQIIRAKRESRNHLRIAVAEMQRFAAGRKETDAVPPYMDMVDVDDLKAACNLYEKKLSEEAARANRLDRARLVLEKKTEKQKDEIEELKGMRLTIAELEVENEKLTKTLKVEKTERIQGAGRQYFLEQDIDALRKENKHLTEELRGRSTDGTLDPSVSGEPKKISGGSMADAYDEQQQQEIRGTLPRLNHAWLFLLNGMTCPGLRQKVEKQDNIITKQEKQLEELRLELQQTYYKYHQYRSGDYAQT